VTRLSRLTITSIFNTLTNTAFLPIIVSLCANIPANILGVHRFSYDAYTHMFFADHYMRGWFNLWDDRWYGGFSVTTYPPLMHQLTALVGFVTGVENSYRILTTLSAALLTYSVFLYSKAFVEEKEAIYAALVAALMPATGIMLNGFGQLPTIASTAFALLSAYSYQRYLSNPKVANLIQASLFTALVGLTHHVTFVFFFPLAAAPILVKNIRTQRGKTIKYTLPYLALTGILLFSVLHPFIHFAISPTPWVEIPHGSRENILADPVLSLMFFWGMYSFTIAFIPTAIAIALRRKELVGVLSVFSLLFIMGLGGTTPIPKIVLGPLWPILTYDKFAFWAATVFSVLIGVMVKDVDVIAAKYYGGLAVVQRRPRTQKVLTISLLVGLAISYVFASGASALLNLQPTWQLTKQQIEYLAAFLNSNADWKYVTLGLGSQRILLSMMTVAPSLDGGYNQAKTDPMLTLSGVESIDAAKYFPNGLNLLKKVLEQESNNGLRFIISADDYYNIVLRDFGLRKVSTLKGERDVVIWEIPYAKMSPISGGKVESPFTVVAWSIGPLLTLALAFVSTLYTYVKGKNER